MTLQEFQKKIPAIKSQLDGGAKKVVIVDGPQGPTGKTTAVKALRNTGIQAFEEYEVIRVTLDTRLW